MKMTVEFEFEAAPGPATMPFWFASVGATDMNGSLSQEVLDDMAYAFQNAKVPLELVNLYGTFMAFGPLECDSFSAEDRGLLHAILLPHAWEAQEQCEYAPIRALDGLIGLDEERKLS